MAGNRTPTFTAERSLENFMQEGIFARSGTGRNGIIPAMKGGCCGGHCDHPCRAGPCKDGSGKCCCNA